MVWRSRNAKLRLSTALKRVGVRLLASKLDRLSVAGKSKGGGKAVGPEGGKYRNVTDSGWRKSSRKKNGDEGTNTVNERLDERGSGTLQNCFA